jgi:hypothetical protein
MRPSNIVWQGNFGYWQNIFIHNNLLVMGYKAWNGFQSFGRGIVLCDVVDQVTHSRMTNLEIVPFTIQFIPSNLIGFYLRSQSVSSLMSASISEMSASISAAVATYSPHQDIILMLKADPQIEVNLLHNLKITPPHCYEQVCKHWQEFQPSLSLMP